MSAAKQMELRADGGKKSGYRILDADADDASLNSPVDVNDMGTFERRFDSFAGIQYAVECRKLERSYGKHKVLKKLNMKVPSGSIYGLLGPSGCGKTTLLKCILGAQDIHGGLVDVFGEAPGTKGHPVPGPAVGFMPQDIALAGAFTIGEVMRFYAKLYDIPQPVFEERKKMLLEMLAMPSESILVRNLSGGQQRRTSLMAALIHAPRLLILDEPTVGVDPLLRSRIWRYMQEIAAQGATVIITTHYIEEAAAADVVGMMRNGKLLAEGKPQDLMYKFQQKSLEDTFLLLCTQQGEAVPGDGPDGATDGEGTDTDGGSMTDDSLTDYKEQDAKQQADPYYDDEDEEEDEDDIEGRKGSVNEQPLLSMASGTGVRRRKNNKSGGGGGGGGRQSDKPDRALNPPQSNCFSHPPRARKVWALVWGQIQRQRRNIALIIFQFLLPSVQVALFCLAIGKNPQHIKFSVVNADTTGVGEYNFAHNFTDILDQGNGLDVNTPDTIGDALDLVHNGKSWGWVSIPAMFTNATIERYVLHHDTPEIAKESSLEMQLDQTNQQVSVFIEQAVSNAYDTLIKDIAKAAGVPALPSSPVTLGQPIYGTNSPKFTDFIAPGMIICISFAQAIGLTAISFVMEKKLGLLDRVWAAGIRPSEVMLSHVINQFTLLVMQLVCLLFFALYIFKLPLVGSLGLVALLAVSLGVAGMVYGLLISAGVEDEQAANQLSMASFFPVLLLSGIIWPVEAIPTPLRYISYALPTTWAADSLRSVMGRGWGLDKKEVWMGFVVVAAWAVFFFLCSVSAVKSRKK